MELFLLHFFSLIFQNKMIEHYYYDYNNNLSGFYETLYINTYTEYLQYPSKLIMYK